MKTSQKQLLERINKAEKELSELKSLIEPKPEDIKYLKCIESDVDYFTESKIYEVLDYDNGQDSYKMNDDGDNQYFWPLDDNDGLVFEPVSKEEYEAQQMWPQVDDRYYFIDTYGDVEEAYWHDDSVDHERRDFLGIYKTEGKAEINRDKIREFAQS